MPSSRSPWRPISSCRSLGERGLLLVPALTQFVPFRAVAEPFLSLSNRHGVPHRRVGGRCAQAVLALSAWPQQRGTIASAMVWGALWLLYLSFVNVGQTFYGFGWETLTA